MSSEDEHKVVNLVDFKGRQAELQRERDNVVFAKFRKTVPDPCVIHVLKDPSKSEPPAKD